MIPTPRAQARTKCFNRGQDYHSNLEEWVGAKLWPTPRSCSAMAAESIGNRVNDKFPNLESVVAQSMWPTPTARDYKGGRKPETLEASGRGATNSLNDALTCQGQSGSLNPTWVEWLMGFPSGWTDLKDSETQ